MEFSGRIHVYQQTVRISTSTNCAPLAGTRMNMIVYSINKRVISRNKIKSFKLTFCYTKPSHMMFYHRMIIWILYIQRSLRLRTRHVLQNGVIIFHKMYDVIVYHRRKLPGPLSVSGYTTRKRRNTTETSHSKDGEHSVRWKNVDIW